MSQTRETIRDKNPYKRGADDGLIMGGLLIVVFLVSVFAVESGFIALIAGLLMFVAVPVTTFIMLKRSNDRDNGCTLFSSLWVQGIVLFFCGTLILAMFQYLYFRFIAPTYVADVFNAAAQAYDEIGTKEAQDISFMLHRVVETHSLPSPIELAVMTLWGGIFTGSILSAILGGIVKFTYRFQSKSKQA